MRDTERTSRLRECGTGIQIGAALLLVGALAGFGVRAATGEWPAVLSHELTPSTSAATHGLFTLLGAIGFVLGRKIKKGDLNAARWATAGASIMLFASLIHLVATGHGWYETLFSTFLVLDGAISIALSHRRA
jgi:hypothetical protein